MADNNIISLLGTMDHLWFHQIVLFTQPTSVLLPKSLKTHFPDSESLIYKSSNSSIPENDIPSVASPISSQEDTDSDKEIEQNERPTRLDSQSLSSSTQKRLRYLRYSSPVMRLQKSMSCKSLWELEVEEVKGFMDLGFKFNKQHLSPKMMSVLPGLQRLEARKSVQKYDETEGEDEKREVMRPYLSEAWLISKPDSPLLNLRIPRVSATAEMKKHLKYWATTVASIIQQES